MHKKPYVIFDLDGTIADCSHRLHHIKEKPKNFKKFHQECLNDPAIQDVKELVDIMAGAGYSIVFCTGRSEDAREDTVKWLNKHFPQVEYILYMRPTGNHEPDWIMKVSLLARNDELTPDKVFAIFEDRDRVVEAWRDHGYRCYQVCAGNY